MPRIEYIEKQFSYERAALIEMVNKVISSYRKQGYTLTLRQVYYQMVARDIIPNNERSYKNLGNLINDARLAGLIDWEAIEDRTRNMRSNTHWEDPEEIMNGAVKSFMKDHWRGQPYHVEVWVEKDALVGIVGQICGKLDVNHFSCRGYVSQSEMWVAAQRLIAAQEDGKQIVLLHLGDHDPSGKDMSRDIVERLDLFGVYDLTFKRLALNYDQIEEYSPPPNPTKVTDSRAKKYMEDFGTECWELDALEPRVIKELIGSHVLSYRDNGLYEEVLQEENEEREFLQKVSGNWAALSEKWDDIEREYL